MTDIGTSVGFDIGPALEALTRLGSARETLAGEFAKSNAAISQSFNPIAQAIGDVATESRAAAAAQRQFAGDIAGLVKEIRDQAAAQREAQQAGAAAAAERRKASAEARAAAKAEKEAAKEAAAAAKEVAAAERLRAKEAAAANAESGKGGGILGGLGKVLGSLQGQIVAAFGVAAIKAFFNEVRENALITEATLGKLTFSNGGDVQAAARDLAYVRFEADRLGLDLNTAGKSYGSFTAAATAANFPLAEARKLFLATARASTTLKLSADDTQGVLLAFTQILSKGTVAAEELRGQIGERLPGAFSIAARAMGVTEQQLNKLLQTGQIKSIDFLPKFAAELQKTFGDGTAQAFDSAIANQNRFENEYNAFLLRFQGATAAATSKAAGYFKRFNEGLDLRSVGGRERLGEAAAQPGIQNYEAILAKLINEAQVKAKADGQDVGFQVNFLIAEQRNLLEKQLEEARKDIARNNPEGRAFPEQFRQAQVQAFARVKLLEGEIAKLGEVAEARKKADMPTDIEGLVKRQQDIIKALKARQLAATQENKGTGDYLLGAGGLGEQLKAAEKELDRLLGKVDKAAKAAADRLAAALRALEAARRDLAIKGAEAAKKDADDQTERAQFAYEAEIAAIRKLKDALVERERVVAEAARKRGGAAAVKRQGSNADGVIDGAEGAIIREMQTFAERRLTKELERIDRERQALLLNLQKESDQKELDQLEAAFNEQVRLHEREAGVLLALEEKYGRDRDALLRAQATRRAGRERQLGSSQASATAEAYGAGTGQSFFDAQLSGRQQQLDADRTFAEKRLDILKDSKTKEAQEERAALAAQLLRIRNQQKQLDYEQKLGKFSIYKLILGENDDERTRAALDKVASQVVESLAQIVSAEEQAAAQRVAVSNQVITELTGQLAAQIQLNEQGSASNIKGLQEQIASEKAARREALEDQRKAAKEKVLIDTLTQASSIATAAAQVFAAFSAIPFVGIPLGIGAAALLVGAFVASKAQAYAAAGNIGSGFFQGGYTGGDSTTEERGVVHGKEFVHTAEKTVTYRTLFDALHNDTPDIINWELPQYRALLPKASSALLPDLELPNKLREERAQSLRVQHEHSFAPMQTRFDRMDERLAAIEHSNSRMANRPDRVPLGASKYIEIEENGSTHVKDLG